MNKFNKFDRIKLIKSTILQNIEIPYDYPNQLEGILNKEEYEQLVFKLNEIINTSTLSLKYKLAPIALVLFCAFFMILLYFVDAITKDTAIGFSIIIFFILLLTFIYYYTKINENRNEKIKQLNQEYDCKGIRIMIDNVKKLEVEDGYSYNVIYLYYKNNNNNNNNNNSNSLKTVQLAKDEYNINNKINNDFNEGGSSSNNNHINNNKNNSVIEMGSFSTLKEKESLLTNNGANYHEKDDYDDEDTGDVSLIIHENYQQQNQHFSEKNQEKESLTSNILIKDDSSDYE